MHLRKLKRQNCGLLVAAVAITCALAMGVAAQEKAAVTLEAANVAFQAQKWDEAAKAYEEISQRDPANAMAWFRLGVSRQGLREFAPALDAFEKAQAAGFTPSGPINYRLARAHARLGHSAEAKKYLEQLMSGGFAQPQMLENVEDFAGVRGEAWFVGAVQQANLNAHPCEVPEHRQFDFWVGEWDVYVSGQKIAHSSIQNILAGCVIFENWQPLNGGQGKSFNYFDPQVKKWRQFWVSSQPGGAINFIGERKGNTMYMECETLGPNGVRTLGHMTWTDLAPDKVRQLWEQSTDGGKTWTTAFDGEYRRQM